MGRINKDYGNRGKPKPICLTCNEKRVSQHNYRYCSPACVPRVIRQMAGAKAGESRRYRGRRRIFEQEFARLTKDGRRLTKEAILDAFALVADRFYSNGYNACRKRFQGSETQEAA